MSLREEIFKIVYTEDPDNPDLVWHTYQDKRIEMIIQAFEKRIDSIDECNLDGESKRIVKQMFK